MPLVPLARASRVRSVLLALGALSAVPALSVAQQATPAVAAFTPPIASAARREGTIVIDGKLDEAAWAKATPITAFRQEQPHEGAAASMPTEVRILFDEDALYIGARMVDPMGRAGIRAPLARRDQLLAADGNNGSFNSLTTDKIAIDLDPYHNHIDDAWFEVNPAGVKGDQFNGDPSWDPIWEAATQVNDSGWTAEMRIPYSQLRFSRDSIQTWGMQIWRYADRLNEQDMWSFRKLNENSGPAYFGELTGLAIPKQPHNVELLPYIVSKGHFAYAAPGDPYHSTHDASASVGGDVKLNLTSNLTLDATFNPDFGQVEVDPAVLNLSAYETYYDEKRPFFVANRSAFSFGGNSCFDCSNFEGLGGFYTRRIGRAPQLNGVVANEAAYADTPDQAQILGAAKVTGRTSSGYTVGLLEAVTNRETARFVTTPGGPQQEQVVEPLTNYFVGHVKKEFRNGGTTVGALVTSTVRQLGSDTLLTDRLRSDATAVGVDWSHWWGNRTYRWRGTLMASDVQGSAQAIDLTQRSSTHWWQRPDRHVTSDGLFSTVYDPTATAMRGYGAYMRLAKENGNWLWELNQNWRSPGFEVNDLSIQGRSDYKWMNGNVLRMWMTPTKYYRSVMAIAGGQQQLNYDGVRNDLRTYYFMQYELPNYWNIRAYQSRTFSTLDDRLTRGGPVVERVGNNYYQLGISTDPRGVAVWNLQNGWARGFDGTQMLDITPGVAFKPASNVFIQLSPNWHWEQDAAQYVTAQADPTATAFSGNRYVFSYITTRTASLETRVNWTFTPTLTLQVYAQPFIATGEYKDFGEYAAPRTRERTYYGRDAGTISYDAASNNYTVDPDGAGPAAAFTFANPNFTARSVRGTAVLRWEYRTGSTIYFVWTQQRSGYQDSVGSGFGSDARQLWGDRPDNVFQVKATYWIGR